MKIFSKFNFIARSQIKSQINFQYQSYKMFCKYNRDLPHLNVGTIGIYISLTNKVMSIMVKQV